MRWLLHAAEFERAGVHFYAVDELELLLIVLCLALFLVLELRTARSTADWTITTPCAAASAIAGTPAVAGAAFAVGAAAGVALSSV